jgi:hypothetical protein
VPPFSVQFSVTAGATRGDARLEIVTTVTAKSAAAAAVVPVVAALKVYVWELKGCEFKVQTASGVNV